MSFPLTIILFFLDITHDPTSSCAARLSGVLHCLSIAIRIRPRFLSQGCRTLVWVLPASLGPSAARQALPDLEAPSYPLCRLHLPTIQQSCSLSWPQQIHFLASPNSFCPQSIAQCLKDPVVSTQQHAQPGQSGPMRWRMFSECH